MSREWKPGDVVLDPDQTGAARVALVVSPHFSGCPSAHREYGVHVHYGDGDWNALKDRFLPLVVIDPEDREAVERLLSRYLSIYDGMDAVPSTGEIATMQAALREYANPKPPRPDEPKGLGAVVEDEDGYLYVRGYVNGESTHEWHVIDPASNKRMGWWKYDEIAVVRVLSPGVEVNQ